MLLSNVAEYNVVCRQHRTALKLRLVQFEQLRTEAWTDMEQRYLLLVYLRPAEFF